MARRPHRDPPLAPEVRLKGALTEVVEALRDLARRADAPVPEALTLDLRPHAKPADRTRAILADLEAAFAAARPGSDPWREGAVHCFWCAASDCAHARPPGPGSVFAGYAATGKAMWADFVQSCVDRRLQGLEGLFADPPQALAFVQQEALTSDLLPAFDVADLAWRPRGQVCLGMIPADLAQPRGDRVALSAQIIETRRPGAPLALRLNMVGLDQASLAQAAASGPPRGSAEQLRRVIQHARRAVGRIGRRAVVAEARGDAYDVDQAIASMLGQLRADLERVFTPQHRRTRHAEERHVDGERPTSAAFKDARDASADQLLYDTRRETIVVIGPRSRAHVFSASGQHVTSLRLEPGELDRKLGQRRWRLLHGSQIAAFRAALERT